MSSDDFRHKAISNIQTDQQSGASQLARRCLQYLSEYATLLKNQSLSEPQIITDKVTSFANQLQSLRPSMAPIENLLQRLIDTMGAVPSDPSKACDFIQNQAKDITEQSELAVTQVAQQAATLFQPNTTIFTHSISSTVIAVFIRVANYPVKAIITESRPGLEGKRLAEKLASLKIDTTYITEAQIGLFIDRADQVIVGADSILQDGSVVNKAGTYLLALAAKDHAIPFYVCCESFKHSLRTIEEIQLEEKAVAELGLTDMPGVTPRNIYFDITPSRLISGYVTEDGLQSAD